MSITRKIPASTPPRRFLPKFFKTGKACGGNNSPRTPLFLPPGFAGSAGQDEREDYARGQGGGGECSRKAVFRRSGPRATSGARPTAGAQPEFSSGVKRSRRRASKAVRTACLAQTGLCVLREACKVRNNSPRTPLFLPPGFAGSAGQDEREDYARGQGGGGGVQSEGRFSTLWGPRATSGARPTAGAQPEFSSGVKRSRRRASKAVRTACLAQTGLCVLREAEVWKDWDCEGGGLADAVRAAYSVQVCPHGLTCGGRLLSGLRRTVVSKEGISRFLGMTPSVTKVNRKVFS